MFIPDDELLNACAEVLYTEPKTPAALAIAVAALLGWRLKRLDTSTVMALLKKHTERFNVRDHGEGSTLVTLVGGPDYHSATEQKK